MGGGIWFLSDDFYCNFYPIILHHLPIRAKICLVLLLKVSKHAKLDAQHAKNNPFPSSLPNGKSFNAFLDK